MVKNLPTMQETWARSLGWEDPLEEHMATHSSILPWRISLVGCSPWGHKQLGMTERLSTHTLCQGESGVSFLGKWTMMLRCLILKGQMWS